MHSSANPTLFFFLCKVIYQSRKKIRRNRIFLSLSSFSFFVIIGKRLENHFTDYVNNTTELIHLYKGFQKADTQKKNDDDSVEI